MSHLIKSYHGDYVGLSVTEIVSTDVTDPLVIYVSWFYFYLNLSY